MKLVLGLGNPGDKYACTRHNIGFMAVDLLSERHGIRLKEDKRHKSLAGKGKVASRDVVLAKPRTFMNLSGEAAWPLFSYFDVDMEELIVIHDDLDLEFGRVKIKLGGGHGGHNGLRSIISRLGGSGFVRVRIGIGKPPHGGDVSGYVLSPFSSEEKADVGDIVARSADAAEAVIRDGVLNAMNTFN